MPTVMPSTRRCGVDSAFPSLSSPVVASKAATSVKGPPMSAARRTLERATRDGDRLGGFNAGVSIARRHLVPPLHRRGYREQVRALPVYWLRCGTDLLSAVGFHHGMTPTAGGRLADADAKI